MQNNVVNVRNIAFCTKVRIRYDSFKETAKIGPHLGTVLLQYFKKKKLLDVKHAAIIRLCTQCIVTTKHILDLKPVEGFRRWKKKKGEKFFRRTFKGQEGSAFKQKESWS